MRLSNALLLATTILFLWGMLLPREVLSDPIEELFEKKKIDSVFTSDSLNRIKYVQKQLDRAAQYLEAQQPDSAILNATLATRYDLSLVPGALLAEAYYLTGKSNRILNQTDLALKNYLMAIQKLRFSEETDIRSDICQELALIYYENGWLSKSIEKYIDAYSVEKRIGNLNKQVELLKIIAGLFEEIHDYPNALVYQEELLNVLTRYELPGTTELMQEIAANYAILEEYQSAIYLHSQILENYRKAEDISGQLSTMLDIIKIYKAEPNYNLLYRYVRRFNEIYKDQPKKSISDEIMKLKAESLMILGDLSTMWGNLEVKDNYERAVSYYDSAGILYATVQDQKNMAITQLSKANVFYSMNDFKSAVDHATFAAQQFEAENDIDKIIQANQLLTQSYMNLDKYKQAFAAQSKVLQYTDSLNERQGRKIVQQIDDDIGNVNRLDFQHIEQRLLQEELDTLSDELFRLEIEKQKRDIELLIKEKSLKDLALKNEQLKNDKVTNENILLQQKIEADLREKEILNLQAIRSQQDNEIKNQQITQIQKDRELYALEQEKKMSDLKLEKARVQKLVYLLIIVISVLILISVIIGYVNIRKSRRNIVEKNKLIQHQNIKLKDLNEEKNRLIRIVAHDLKNPLTSAITISDVLYKGKNLEKDNNRDHISLIRRSLKRMNEMINKILDIKAIDAEDLNLDFESINIRLIIEYIVESFARNASIKHIGIFNETDEIYVRVDRNYFIQILENLISNALKFSESYSTIRIYSEELDNACRIAISDDGPGLTKEEISELFLENRTLSPKPTNGESSNGIGLSIVKKYVDAMKGKVWCESSPGEGSTFYLEFEKSLVLA